MLELTKEIIQGRRLKRGEDFSFFASMETKDLAEGADQIRKALCRDAADLCTIINGRSGRCGEDCKFCAQSAFHTTGCETYELLDEKIFLEDCRKKEEAGVHAYSIVTAGRKVAGEELDRLVHIYESLRAQSTLRLCASLGLVSKEAFLRLRTAGVSVYHANIETSRRYFPQICTTHTYEDKIKEIALAKEAGFRVCSGGIIGMGETWEDRMDMALSLAEMEITSIPINVLIPVKGTMLENVPPLTEDEIIRTVAMFRYFNPTAYIRIAAGRRYCSDGGRKLFQSGANAAITGDMLTTVGADTQSDRRMFEELGFTLKRTF